MALHAGGGELTLSYVDGKPYPYEMYARKVAYCKEHNISRAYLGEMLEQEMRGTSHVGCDVR